MADRKSLSDFLSLFSLKSRPLASAALYEKIKTLIDKLKEKAALERSTLGTQSTAISLNALEVGMNEPSFRSASLILQALIRKIDDASGKTLSVSANYQEHRFILKAEYHHANIAFFPPAQRLNLPNPINRINFDRIHKKFEDLMQLVFSGWDEKNDHPRLEKRLNNHNEALILAASIYLIEAACKSEVANFSFQQQQPTALEKGTALTLDKAAFEEARRIFGLEQGLDLTSTPVSRL